MLPLLTHLRRKVFDWTLGLLSLASAVLMCKASTDPRPGFIKNTWVEDVLQPFSTGNQIVFDISVGVLVGLFVYVLIVRIPEFQKRRRIRLNLTRHYDDLKEACILQFLWASNTPAESTLIRRLKNRHDFKEFFSERVSSSQDRWHAVMNGLDDTKVAALVHELTFFRGELEFGLSSVDVSDPQVFAFLKGLTRALHGSQTWSADYDAVKELARFMWSLHTGWNWVDGYSSGDTIGKMIARL